MIDLPDLFSNQKSAVSFSETALMIFKFQAENNPVYCRFVSGLGVTLNNVTAIGEIPFLPIGFFKDQTVAIENLSFKVVFESSRTTGSSPSRHFVHDLNIYEESFGQSFRYFYGEPSEYLIAALLPSYSERGNSSLVYMMNGLIRESRDRLSGFYNDNPGELIKNLSKAKAAGRKTLLLGVSFALLDLADRYSPDLSGTIVMETGGMKGRRKEITREELHGILRSKLNVPVIHSEYGMTEMLSQAYSCGNGIFHSPPWLRILIRDPQDPLTVNYGAESAGGINIIDLANIYSCSFLATGDIGKLHADGGFEVLGRFDNTDVRGCNLMADY